MISLDHEIHFGLSAFHETAKHPDSTRESYFIWRDFLTPQFFVLPLDRYYAKKDNLFDSKSVILPGQNFYWGGMTWLIEYCIIISIL